MNSIQLDFRSGVPIYLQIVEQIQSRVVNGVLKVGEQLPTVRQLATELRVNFNTIARAYRMLDEMGLISTQQGRGTYILETPSKEDIVVTRQQRLTDLAARYIEEAHSLGYVREEILEAVSREAACWSEAENINSMD